jgi:hypothetical protein
VSSSHVKERSTRWQVSHTSAFPDAGGFIPAVIPLAKVNHTPKFKIKGNLASLVGEVTMTEAKQHAFGER